MQESERIDCELVRRLVASQFPQWAELPIVPVEVDGHDNRSFRLGDEMSVRLPRAEWYAPHVSIEHERLPQLAAQLEWEIPVPLGKGRPDLGYQWPWSVNRWVVGETANRDRISDMNAFAEDLGFFLKAFHRLDSTKGPRPGPANFYRGGPLLTYDEETRECIKYLGTGAEKAKALALWEIALSSVSDSSPVWVHGDVAVGNLLVREGRLCGVIDFGQLAVGDPACDLVIAWTLFCGESRSTFRSVLGMDDATWARARAWALWKAVLTLRLEYGKNAVAYEFAAMTLSEVLSE